MTLRTIYLAVLMIVFTIPALPQNEQEQNVQDRDHQNSAISASEDPAKSESQMQKSVPAAQEDAAQAARDLARQTSSDHVSWSSTSALVWGLIGFAVLVVLAAIAWRSGRRCATGPQTREEDIRRAA